MLIFISIVSILTITNSFSSNNNNVNGVSHETTSLNHLDQSKINWSISVANAVKSYFSQPYADGDSFNPILCFDGSKIYRPNHSLAHGMRQAYLAVDIVLFIKRAKLEHFGSQENKDFYKWVQKKSKDPKFLHKIEFVNAFQRTGRQSEISRSQNSELYERYLKSDQENLKTQTKKLMDPLFNSLEEFNLYKEALIKKPDRYDPNGSNDLYFLSKILYASHLLDLRRIPHFSKERILNEISESLFSNKLTEEEQYIIAKLWKRSGDYLNVTGDRDIDNQQKSDWDSAIFCSQAQHPELLVQALQQARIKSEKQLLKSIVKHTQVIRELKERPNASAVKRKDPPAIADLRAKLKQSPYTASEGYLKIYLGNEYKEIPLNMPENKAREITKDNITKFLAKRIPNPDQRYLDILVECMMEERRNRDKTVIYHTTDPSLGFLYDIYTELRNQLIMEGDNNTRALRVLDTEFFKIDEETQQQNYNSKKKATVLEFMAKFKGIRDEDRSFQAMGLSTNILFGSDGELHSDTYNMFYKLNEGQVTLSPPPIENFFNHVSQQTGIPGDFTQYKPLFNRFILTCKDNISCWNGRLIQIFVDPQIVDKITYPSVIWGFPIQKKKNNEIIPKISDLMIKLRTNPEGFITYLSEQTEAPVEANMIKGPLRLEHLQIRLFMRPDVMLNKKLVQVKSYWRFDPPENLKLYYASIKKLINKSLVDWLQTGAPSTENALNPKTTKLKKFTEFVYAGSTGQKAPKALPVLKESRFIQLLIEQKEDQALQLFNEHYVEFSRVSFSVPQKDYSNLPMNLLEVLQYFDAKKIFYRTLELGFVPESDLILQFISTYLSHLSVEDQSYFLWNIGSREDLERTIKAFESCFDINSIKFIETSLIKDVFGFLIKGDLDSSVMSESRSIIKILGRSEKNIYLRSIIGTPSEKRLTVPRYINKYVLDQLKTKEDDEVFQNHIHSVVFWAHRIQLKHFSPEQHQSIWQQAWQEMKISKEKNLVHVIDDIVRQFEKQS